APGEGKERERELMVGRQRQSIRNTKDDKDRISELPIHVFLRILEFMNTRDAVRLCALSKSWKDFWKRLTTLSFDSWESSIVNFEKFVSEVLSGRDGSIPLLNLEIILRTDLEQLDDILKYAVSHNIQQLKIFLFVNHRFHFVFPSSIFSCQTLTFLRLSPSFWGPIWELRKPLQLPALESLHLENVCFTASCDDCAEPFSSCISLKSLILGDCSLHKNAQVLCINNSNLNRVSLCLSSVDAYKIVFSTPNLCSLTIKNVDCHHQLFSTCSLSFLEVDVNAYVDPYSPFFVSLLQVLVNIKKITLSWSTLRMMQEVLPYWDSVGTRPPCFARLESLKLKIDPSSKISDEKVNWVVKCLLQNSPLLRVDIIKC
ncbi:FBD-associated F-box protein, partial [Glycine soja]